MNTPSPILLKLSLALLCAGAAGAQAQTQGQGSGGLTGMQIANNGTPNGVAACAGCHGQKGEGNAQANFPRIAGQPQVYLAKQLMNYANGSRNNAIMMPIAKGLTREQIDAVSAYYAVIEAPPASPAAQAPAAQMKRGETLAMVGDNQLGVQACANCHGPGGAGEPPTYPYLAGQHASYLTTAMKEWKSGARNTDPSKQMPTIAKRLGDNDISALSAYFAAQPAPVSEARRTNIPVGSTARPATAVSSGSSGQGTTATQGVGSEGGTPTTGGAQGVGGGGGASGAGTSGSSGGEAP
ncbi:c-type cytochrome [Noviherbaspirillum massiliense]|uniref:c-type cytochrome n=1 Tax=Noviherbaspirillum massiliense TaxID=1465823 RepID=UPI0002F9A75C|nr:c-type cytochrome [Noviherbaspirillum massiliense]